MGVQKVCDICGFIRGRGQIRRYSLHYSFRTDPKHWSSATRGAMDICESCWERVAKPKMRKPDNMRFVSEYE